MKAILAVPERRQPPLAEGRKHVSGIKAVAGARGESEDGSTVGDLCGLKAEVTSEGLDDRCGEGGGAGEGADKDAGEAVGEAKKDGVEGDEAVDNGTGVKRAEEQTNDTDEGEEPDGDGWVGVGQGGEEEGQGGPEAGEGGGA